MSFKNHSEGIRRSSGDALFSCTQVFKCENPTKQQMDSHVRNFGVQSGSLPWVVISGMVILALIAIGAHAG
jgi:hypothetical protein